MNIKVQVEPKISGELSRTMVRGARLLVFLLLIGGGRCQSTTEDTSITTTERQSISEDTSITTTESQSTSEDTSVTNSGGKSIYDF